MTLVIGLLTFVLVINSILLILLILIQLPKKEAGAGLAFGGGATDALFGPGSGNVLTKTTKYAAGCFLFLCLTLAILYTHNAKTTGRGVLSELERKASAAAVTPPTTTSNAPLPTIAPLSTSVVPPSARLQLTNLPAATVPAAPAVSNAPAAAPPEAPK
jgi:preprotein translocase subunit SecG